MKQALKNTNDSFQKSRDDIATLLEKILDIAKKKGATDAAVSVGYDRGFSVDVRMQEVDTLAFNEGRSINLTIYDGKRMGRASSTDASDASIEIMVDAAMDIARVSAEDACYGLAEKELLCTEFKELDLYHPWPIHTEEALKMALDCEAQALAMDARIINSDGASVATHDACRGYANTNGAFGIEMGSNHSIYCALLAQDNDKFQRDYEYSSSRFPEQLLTPDAVAAQAVENTIGKLGARKIKTQKAPVIFSNRLSAGLIGHLTSAISGGNLYRNDSFLLDSIGEKIFPDFVHIYEQPFLKGGLRSANFDTDGVQTRENKIVRDGVIEQYILGVYTARRLGMQTTANGGGVRNLSVDASDAGVQSLMKKMGTGFLVTDVMGQGVNGLTGDYSRGACGYWIENGTIAFAVEEVTIAGNLRHMYQNIIGIGADVNPNFSTRCGAILIEEMMIAGE